MSRLAVIRSITGVLVFLVCGSSAFAQVIFEPVRYQYQAGGQLYYYGGTDPRVHRMAAEPVGPGGSWGRINGWDFAAGDIDRHREVAFERPVRVFSDAVPGQNAAAVARYTATDAMNDAYASVPRFFRMRDLLATGHVDESGALAVPSQPPTREMYGGAASTGTIEIRPYVRARARARTAEPRPILIIPKDLLDEPAAPAPTHSIASAR
jgi:hypothetical protein